jgi:hypothetical protein
MKMSEGEIKGTGELMNEDEGEKEKEIMNEKTRHFIINTGLINAN